MARKVAQAAGGLALLVVLALAATGNSPRRVALEEEGEELNSDVGGTLPETGEVVDKPKETTEMVYAEQHPVYTRCARRVDMPEFVKTIRKSCGNIHELQTLAPSCRDVLEEHSKEFGCCWETVMNAYAQLDPQAHHSWRMWQGTLSGKSGVTFVEDSCGDAMGEHDYHHLEDEVGDMKDTIEAQQKELQTIEGILMMAMGFKGTKRDDLHQLSQMEGARGATHAPFSAGELEQALSSLGHRNVAAERRQMMGRRVAHARHAMHQARTRAAKGSYFFQNPVGDEGVEKMQEAGVNV